MTKKNSRTNNSIKNSIASIFYSCITIIMTFVAQSIFIKVLGSEYNGIKSLFLNLLSMLSVVELGFGMAIVYNLYKPIADDNKKEIKVIVKFYKKVYQSIALIIFILGLLLTCFIPNIVGETSINENIYLLFILYLLNTSSSYLLSYKRSILYADQKNYLINIVDVSFNVVRNIFQIAILLIFKNFVLYLLIQILITIINNLVICAIVNKKYPYLKNINDSDEIDVNLKKDIIKKVKGLLFHKIGGFFVTGTDNILISITKGLGVVYVGFYSNYNMIIYNVSLIFSTIIGSMTASVGNLLTEKEDNLKNKKIYNSMLLINSWIYCFGMVSIFCLIEPFIQIWIGKEYLLSRFVLIILMINFYTDGMKRTSNTFKEAAGVFYEDRHVPIIESIVNIVFSLIFMRFFGLAGVFMGTVCSSLVLLCYSYPKYVYKGILKGKRIDYFKVHGYYLFITFIVSFVTIFVNSFVIIDSLFLEILIKGLICLFLTNLLFLIIVWRTRDFEYYKNKIILKFKKS